MSDSLPKQKNLISISQAAKFLGVSIDTVRRWDNSGVLRSQRPDGKNRYFSLEELEAHKSGQPLSISEAAKELGVSPTTLRRLESRGLLKPARNSAGERVYDRDSLKNFLSSDYFRRKNQITGNIPGESIAPEKTQDIETKNPAADNIIPAQSFEEITSDSNFKQSLQPDGLKQSFSSNKPSYRIPEILATVVIFILLSSIGVTNITLAEMKNLQATKSSAPSSNAAVLSETVTFAEVEEASISAEPGGAELEVPEAEPTTQPVTLESIQSLIDEAADYAKEASEEAQERTQETGGPDLDDFKIILSIKTSGAGLVNIREKPSTESGKIAEARNGETFNMISRDSDWYEVKLNDGTHGFISEEFAQIKEIN